MHDGVFAWDIQPKNWDKMGYGYFICYLFLFIYSFFSNSKRLMVFKQWYEYWMVVATTWNMRVVGIQMWSWFYVVGR